MRIEIQDLSKRFGAAQALRDVSFQVPAGRRVALIGPNGSGKSTLNRILMGLLDYEGDVRLDGRSPREERMETARAMAYVPQIAPRLAAPVGELLAAVGRVRGIERSAFARLAADLGLDLAAVERRPFSGLSGGMRQKLLIALALASRASLLILDEPTGSLDAASRECFFARLGEAAEEATVLLCSHRLDELRHQVEHVLVLEEGRLRYDGPADAFLAATARTRVEVRVVNGEAGHWLESRGFRPGAGGWWSRTVDLEQKRALVGELGSLGSGLADLVVRDLESVEDERPSGGAGPDGEGR